MELMRAGRARWRIEHETFNPLKTQGDSFEHNFGHGEKPLSAVFAYRMMRALLIDPIQQRGCRVFQHAPAKAGRARDFWEKVRGLFLPSRLVDWETRYRALAFGYRAPEPVSLETS